MSNDEFGKFFYELPVWTIADSATPPCKVFVLAHERQGPTLLIFTDEDAAMLYIERAPLAGKVTLKIEDKPKLRDLVATLASQGVRHVGIDTPAEPSKFGRFMRINDFLAELNAS